MINNSWTKILKEELSSEYFNNILKEIKKEYKNHKVYPDYENIFNFLNLTSYEKVKVVIVGQDPYHGENQAHGLAFSSLDKKLPPSLRNIYKELKNDLGIVNEEANLTPWAKEGVLLINSSLTVRKGLPNSHRYINWDRFTDKIIEKINNKKTPVVFILWGNFAKEKKVLITNKNHLILESAHPSPFSAHKFWGNKHFSKTNKFLKETNQTEINWEIKKEGL